MEKLLLKFSRNERGNIAILSAIVMPLLIGAVGFGTEVAYWYHEDDQLQQTADRSAFAAGIELRAGSSSSAINAAALNVAAANGFIPSTSPTQPASGPSPSTGGGQDTLTVDIPPVTGAYVGNPNAVQVIIQKFVPLTFSSLFLSAPVAETLRSVALIQTASNACVLALSTTASQAVSVGGNAAISLTGCNVDSNSVAGDSIKTYGSSSLKADCILTVGGVDLAAGSTSTVCANPIVDTPPVADPLAGLQIPTSSTTWMNSSGSILQPGVYPNGLNLTGTKVLQPGVYIITGGSFNVGANANITGSGVTFYIANGVNVSMNANGYVNLSAPTSGPYSGVLFFGARDGTGSVTLNGTASSLLTGTIYFPNQNISYNGNFSGNGGCTHVVASTVSWSGSAAISQNCTAYGMSNIPSVEVVKLVE
ncbi:MAG: hypothetical protein KGO53_04410 [Alphaproteobacteria bacterium]|nr:hypothetical protein [Alphaproteobacteria bacterium]